MKNEQTKEITNKSIKQLIAALNEGRIETLTAHLNRDGQIPPLQLTQGHVDCNAEANCHARRRLSRLAQVRALREERREGHP